MDFKIDPSLKRYPFHKRDLLQAWDSADELILEHLGGLPGLSGQRILILNDNFGALSCGLEGLDITAYTDSYVSAQGIRLNSGERLQPLHRLQDLQGPYDLALIRIPKNMSFFEDQLCHLSGHLRPSAPVICGYMVKHQANSSFDLLTRLIGDTRTSLARKKARLIFAELKRPATSSPYPLQIPIESFDLPFVNPSNLFSREKLDIGTRFLLEHIPSGDFSSILDLGCGNGILGIAAKNHHPRARLLFSDESQMAVASARTNFEAYFPEESQAPGAAEFHWTHCFEEGKPDSLDLVLCNPPFHQGNTQGDFITMQMFRDSHRTLRSGGLIRVVGNSHLQHAIPLKRIFGNSRIVAQNTKFTIVDARKE